MDQIIWLEDKKAVVGTHNSLMQSVFSYRTLFEKGGQENETKK